MPASTVLPGFSAGKGVWDSVPFDAGRSSLVSSATVRMWWFPTKKEPGIDEIPSSINYSEKFPETSTVVEVFALGV